MFVLAPISASAVRWQERSDWVGIFVQLNADGTILVLDERANARASWVYKPARAQQRFSPASTFKIAHTLFALDAGFFHDEFQIFSWDGQKRDVASWNQDQDLRSAMRNSVVWVYQQAAQAIGEPQERRYLRQIGYGNADPSGGVDGFWVDGNLLISAEEQVAFLQRLYHNQLPFSVEHQRLVKDLMIVEAGRDWILRAKSGWNGRVGWWIGWVEWPNGPVFFALNIDTPNRIEDLYKREAITRRILRSIEVLPPE